MSTASQVIEREHQRAHLRRIDRTLGQPASPDVLAIQRALIAKLSPWEARDVAEKAIAVLEARGWSAPSLDADHG